MCGITGYLNLREKPIQDTSRVLKMLQVQEHRGPDDKGIRAFNFQTGQSVEAPTDHSTQFEEDFFGVLGFNRLSILDLSENGHQPMVSPDGKVILMLNGEIYNAFDFTEELEAWGYSFRSTSDTEVVLALYLKLGFRKMQERLNGMYAIVVVDLRSKSLYITRDRFGIKPMYYVKTDELFAFSSELKSFKFLEGFDFVLNENQLDEFLLFRNNLNDTLFKGVYSLAPGHYIHYQPLGSISPRKYFDVEKYERSKVQGTLSDYGEQMEEWLRKSVKSQLMSDVKLGCQLSGGVDSSLVTWLANQSSDKGSFESVSIIFDDPNFSEEKYIDQVAEELNITSHKFLLDASYYFKNIQKATWHLEYPINHPNTIGIYKLSQQAKEHVTVLLSGEGADEVFGGYSRYYDLGYPFQVRRLMHQLKKNYKSPVSLLRYMNADSRAVLANAYMTPRLAGNVFPGFSFKRAVNDRSALYGTLSGSLFDKQVKYESQAFLPDLLVRQDKMSMAHSIENRVPFLDNNLVENSFTIPEKLLLLRNSPEGTNTEKYLLKKMSAETFGHEFAFRNKMGFGIPMREFFLLPEFYTYLNNIILPGIKTRGLFNHKLASSWISNIGRLNYLELEAVWIIISFEIWASIYLDNYGDYWNTSC